MMATAQTPRNVTSNWSDFFPAEVDQQQSSTTFVRKLVAVGVSQILYLRSELPEDVFEAVDLDGLPLKMLKGSHDESKGLCELLQSALSGVKRRYLSEMTLALYADPKHPEEAHETYTFSFAYSPDGEAFMTIDAQGDKNKNLRSKTKVQNESLKKMTRKMLRKIITTTQSLDDRFDDIYVTVLLKWNSDTPTDYEPRGFTPADYTFNLHKEEDGVRAGHVKTNFHVVGAKIRAVELKEKSEIAYSQLSQPLSEGFSQRLSQQSQYPKRYSKPAVTPPSIPPSTQDTTIVVPDDLPDTTTPAVLFTP